MGVLEVSPDKLVKVYLRIKKAREQAKVEFAAADTELKSQQETIKNALLEHCRNHNVDSVKTAEGLFYRSVQKNYWTSDWDSMDKFIIENDCMSFFVRRLNQNNVKAFLEEHPDKLPAGLNAQSTYTLNIRKKK